MEASLGFCTLGLRVLYSVGLSWLRRLLRLRTCRSHLAVDWRTARTQVRVAVLRRRHLHLLLSASARSHEVVVVDGVTACNLAALDALSSVAVRVRASLTWDLRHLVVAHLGLSWCKSWVVSLSNLTGAGCAIQDLDRAVSEGRKHRLR